jgi:hypothetical protein
LFFAGELLAELGGEFGVVEHPHLVPLEEFPYAFAGAASEVELEEEGSDEGEVELVGGASRTFGQPGELGSGEKNEMNHTFDSSQSSELTPLRNSGIFHE